MKTQYFKVTKESMGLYGIEIITVDKNKVVDTKTEAASYPPITLNKFGKMAFEQAVLEYDELTSTKE
jgi:hypothetical protein